MSDETPKTVTVEALVYHTGFGEEHQIGDRYEIDEAFADSVEAQGKAKRIDVNAPPPPAPSQPVEPMTTENFTG